MTVQVAYVFLYFSCDVIFQRYENSWECTVVRTKKKQINVQYQRAVSMKTNVHY
jgi:hypothetical protein